MIIQSGWRDNPKITIYRLYVLLSEWTDNILNYTFIIVVWERVYSYTEKREREREEERMLAIVLFSVSLLQHVI